ncbi:PH domain-containing protein [Virgibacillus sp. NKC19-16]|uniref:PH domain-containing protein n=1 Tax=Virgibacillus salidurans TaxID=2831673 RepID=UPI001F472021|nr:PH domain-containing protein [Virgibacillus sp. NKC19-16]UJL46224.1 PH domain-containing protein [Virgibacillus sp. NKC19-16]
MIEEKRYHPLLILYNIWDLIKNSIFIAILLFIIQGDSDFWLVTYGRIAFVAIFVLILLYIPIKWFTRTYTFDETSLQLQRNFLTTTKQTIPYAKIQHVKRETTLFHRIFNITSLRIETSIQGDVGTVTFHVLTPKEATLIEEKIQIGGQGGGATSASCKAPIEAPEAIPEQQSESNLTIHFTPTKEDTLKASFTSFSFIAIIPIAGTFISQIERTFRMEGQIEGLFSSIFNSWWMITLFLIVIVLLAVFAGVIWTTIRYGKYEIASDTEKIYITKGMLEETYFSITKDKVQAISVEQSLMKRILGLAEVKLTSAGGMGEDDLEVNTLYPFLPVKRAYAMITEILPSYQLSHTMERLPRSAFWLRILAPSWLWIIATAALYFIEADFLGMEQSWWMISILILVLVIVSRILNFFQSRYVLNDQYVQFKTGGFTTTLFVSKRNKVMEIQGSRNILQKKLGLASLVTVNRAKPVKHTKIRDVPVGWASMFYKWYMERNREVEVER